MSPRITVSNGKISRCLSDAEVVIGSDFAASTLKCDINTSENLLHRHNSPHLKLHTTDNEDDVSISHFLIYSLIWLVIVVILVMENVNVHKD